MDSSYDPRLLTVDLDIQTASDIIEIADIFTFYCLGGGIVSFRIRDMNVDRKSIWRTAPCVFHIFPWKFACDFHGMDSYNIRLRIDLAIAYEILNVSLIPVCDIVSVFVNRFTFKVDSRFR